MQTEKILEETGIAMSTWSAKQGKLVSMGLIEKHYTRVMGDSHVLKRMNYGLTKKGRLVGQNLLDVTNILASTPPESLPEKTLPIIGAQPEKGDQSKMDDVQEMISECIEVTLDSFGSKLIDLVKKSLELEHGVAWDNIQERTQDLESVLKENFGLEASKSLKKLISANIRSRFGLEERGEESLSHLILRARQKNAGVDSNRPFSREEVSI